MKNKCICVLIFICLVLILIPEKILAVNSVVEEIANTEKCKVRFDEGFLAKWNMDIDNVYIEVEVNNEGKLDKIDIPTSDKLKVEGKGLVFKGWRDGAGNIINLTKTVFDKDITLYPVWEYKVIFDANGGIFSDGNSNLVKITNDDDDEIYKYINNGVEAPKKEGYKFVGFYDSETDGNTFKEYLKMNEAFNEEVTFYARWEKSDVKDNELYNNEVVQNKLKVEKIDANSKININMKQIGLCISVCIILILEILFIVRKNNK